YLALVDDSGRIQAGLPLFEVRSPITGNRLVSIPFATLSDPLVETAHHYGCLLESAKRLIPRLGASYLEVRHHLSPKVLEHNWANPSQYVSHFLTLDRDLDELKQSFHRSCVRKHIRRSLAGSLEIFQGSSMDHMKAFYQAYVEMRRRLGLLPQPFRFFSGLWKFLGPQGHLFLLLAKHGVRFVGGLIGYRYKDRVSAEAIGIQEDYRGLGVYFFLYWHAIRLAKEEGFKVFDMGRTSVDNQGLMTFKSRWGTKVVDLPQFFLYNGKSHLKPGLLSAGNVRLRRLCSRLPMPLFKALGSACYRHMG
ncbi:MAG: GNAT family N-acetyltransferase, partial [Candidatus Hadarchaeum sp.]